MTIGPEPMTRTELRSARLPITAPVRCSGPGPARPFTALLHQLAEPAEQPGRVVRAGRGLRVVLDAERGPLQQPQPLDHAVVQVDVADLGRPDGVSNPRSAGIATANP